MYGRKERWDGIMMIMLILICFHPHATSSLSPHEMECKISKQNDRPWHSGSFLISLM